MPLKSWLDCSRVQVGEAIRDRVITAERLVDQQLARIIQLDPVPHAYVTVDAEAAR